MLFTYTLDIIKNTSCIKNNKSPFSVFILLISWKRKHQHTQKKTSGQLSWDTLDVVGVPQIISHLGWPNLPWLPGFKICGNFPGCTRGWFSHGFFQSSFFSGGGVVDVCCLFFGVVGKSTFFCFSVIISSNDSGLLTHPNWIRMCFLQGEVSIFFDFSKNWYLSHELVTTVYILRLG